MSKINRWTVDASGTITGKLSYEENTIYVYSDEIMPKNVAEGMSFFIIDKMAVAISARNNQFYADADKPGTAGQLWSVLFN